MRATASGLRFVLLTVEQPSASTPDGDGGFSETWTPAAPPTLYGRLQAAGAGDLERPVAGTVTAEASHVITVPYHAQITTRTRLTVGARVFAVVGVRDVDERHVELQLACVERVP